MLLSTGAEGELAHTVVVDFEEVVYVDTTGAAPLTGFFAYAQRYGVELSLARALGRPPAAASDLRHG